MTQDHILAPVKQTHMEDYIFGRATTSWVFGLLCLLMVFDFADRMIIASLIPHIQKEWGISDAQAGLLGSILTLGMVLFAFPVSFAIDRWGRIKTASVMGIFWGIASALGAFTHSIHQLAVTRLLVGAGEATYAPASYSWISTAFPRRRLQLALGLFSASQPIGMALGIALGGWIAHHFGWRHALGLMAIPGIVIAIILYKGRDYPAGFHGQKKKDISQPLSPTASDTITPWQGIKNNWQSIITIPSLLFSYLAMAIVTLQWVPVVFFLPSYLHRIHHVQPDQASLLTSVMMLIGIITLPLGGWIMDRLTQRFATAKIYITVTGYAVATLLYVLAFGVFQHNLALQFSLIILAVSFLTFCSSAPLSLTQELVPPAARALSGTTSVMTIHLLGSIPGPLLTGVISDYVGIGKALLIMPLISGVIATVLMLLVLRFYQRDYQRATQLQGKGY